MTEVDYSNGNIDYVRLAGRLSACTMYYLIEYMDGVLEAKVQDVLTGEGT